MDAAQVGILARQAHVAKVITVGDLRWPIQRRDRYLAQRLVGRLALGSGMGALFPGGGALLDGVVVLFVGENHGKLLLLFKMALSPKVDQYQ
jgi:hypothetical protein